MRKIINLGIIYVIVLMLTGCLNTESSISNIGIGEGNSKIKQIEKGSYINLNDEFLQIYSKENIEYYNDIETILAYNDLSKSYIEVIDGGIYLNYEDGEIKLEDSIENIKFSADGKNIMYFKENGISILKILNIESKEIIEIDTEIIISGNFIEWISDNEIIYYGIDIENNINGLFLYNIDTKDEKVLYKLQIGYIEYIKNIDNKVVFIENNFENKVLKEIDNNGEIKEISKDIIEIYDVTISNGEYYIMGKNKDELYSLYKVNDTEIKRLIYDFPYIIDMNEGISVGEDGEVLFIGSDDTSSENHVYKYSSGKISRVTDKVGDYKFINYN